MSCIRTSFVAAVLSATVVSLHAQVPSTYDLRSAGAGGTSLVAAVQNQSLMGDCWTFASATALDSNLLKKGYLNTSTTPPQIQVSSWHISTAVGAPEWLAYNPNREDWESDTGAGNWGGFNWMTMGYLTRGRGVWPVPGASEGTIQNMGGGVVLVSQDPLNAFPIDAIKDKQDMDAYLPPTSQSLSYITNSVSYLDQKINKRSRTEQVAAVKQAMMDHGALTTYMYAGGGSVFKTDSLGNTVTRYTGGKAYSHAVTIIGWDDNYVIDGKKGAWIVQNSWGSDWGNGGTFYASYTDKYIGRAGISAYDLSPIGNNSEFVLQNEFGPVETTGNQKNPLGMQLLKKSATKRTNEVASVIELGQDETLSAIGLSTFVAGAEVKISIYTQWGANGPEGEALAVNSFTFTNIGYQLFQLDNTIALDGDGSLVIVVDYQDKLNVVPYVLGDAAGGLSFYNAGKKGWQDFADIRKAGGTFFVKGITTNNLPKGIAAVPEPSTWALVGIGAATLVIMMRRRRPAGR